MKHAGKAALDALEDVLSAVRGLDGLTEKTRGVFYRKSVATLHFHEDPAGLFADVRLGGSWRRMRVSTRAERRAFLTALRREGP